MDGWDPEQGHRAVCFSRNKKDREDWALGSELRQVVLAFSGGDVPNEYPSNVLVGDRTLRKRSQFRKAVTFSFVLSELCTERLICTVRTLLGKSTNHSESVKCCQDRYKCP